MPTTATTQSLSALLPTLSPHPARLTSLADSLLIQSRQRAANLKPDEEIARTHACAEIACRRLRVQLRLPAVKEGTAPCKPKVYAKLVGYLEGVLEAQGVKRAADGAAKGKGKGKEPEIVLEVPKKKAKTAAGDSDGSFLGKVKINSGHGKGAQQEAPDFVSPSIRTLCKTFGTKVMMPHVYTGSCIVLGLAGRWPRAEDGEDMLSDKASFKTGTLDLVVALYLMVLTRMQKGKMTTKIFRSTSAKAVDALDMRSGTDGIEAWIKTINKEGYCRGQDWWDSVPEGVFDFAPDRIGSDIDSEVEDEAGLGGKVGQSMGRRLLDLGVEDPDGVLLPGLGTMMQDAVDWTSEERKLDFLEWKKGVLRRMDKNIKPGKSVAVR